MKKDEKIEGRPSDMVKKMMRDHTKNHFIPEVIRDFYQNKFLNKKGLDYYFDMLKEQKKELEAHVKILAKINKKELVFINEAMRKIGGRK